MAFNTITASEDTRRALDEALSSTPYRCAQVTWDDVALSNLAGSNFTDTRLRARNGAVLYTLRPTNWNERVGYVPINEVTLLTGNCDISFGSKVMRHVTLEDFLKTPTNHGAAYTGLSAASNLTATSAFNSSVFPNTQQFVSVRFQTVFLPLDDDGTLEFCAEVYSYQTSPTTTPRNLVLLSTTQGLSVHANSVGAKRLLLHDGPPGFTSAYWMRAEASRHAVGTQQHDSPTERADAEARGRATSNYIGVRGMGERFNAMLTIQIPLVQNQKYSAHQVSFGGHSLFGSSQPAFQSRSGFGAASFSGFGSSIPTDSQTKATPFGGRSSSAFGAKPSSGFGNNSSTPQSTPSAFGGGASGSSNGLFGSAVPPRQGLNSGGFGSVQTGTSFFGNSSPSFSQSNVFATRLTPGTFGCEPSATFGSGFMGTVGGFGQRSWDSTPSPWFRTTFGKGLSTAARISRGSCEGHAEILPNDSRVLQRDASNNIVVTVMIYHAVRGGVPSASDAWAAVEELEALYASCNMVYSTSTISSHQVPRPPSLSLALSLITSRFEEIERGQFNKFLELRLLTLGATENLAQRSVLAQKFDELEQLVPGSTEGFRKLAELRLFVLGALRRAN